MLVRQKVRQAQIACIPFQAGKNAIRLLSLTFCVTHRLAVDYGPKFGGVFKRDILEILVNEFANGDLRNTRLPGKF